MARQRIGRMLATESVVMQLMLGSTLAGGEAAKAYKKTLKRLQR